MLKGVEGVMRGYKPQVDWGGEGGSATIMMGRHNVKVATAGWRRRCIFIFLASLLIISILNFILTLWVLRKINFDAEGAGNLHVRAHAIQVEGKMYLTQQLNAAQIEGRKAKNVDITGYYNLSASVVSHEGLVRTMLLLDPDDLQAVAKEFRVLDHSNDILFKVDAEGSHVGAKYFTVTGEEGATFEATVQTPRLLGSSIDEFTVESKTRSLSGVAGSALRVESRAGDINVVALQDQHFVSRKGKIRLASSNVQLPKIPIASSPETQIESPLFDTTSHETSTVNGQAVYQVCVCANGKLFLASDDVICIDEEGICLS